MDSPLDVVGVRVLGSLIEKEITTPDNYPLTLNALVAACNQTSNRDPVLVLDDATVSESLEELSRRPHHCPHETPVVLTARVLEARRLTKREN